jgi:hypothetical protein
MASFAVSRDKYSAPWFRSNADWLADNVDNLFKRCVVEFHGAWVLSTSNNWCLYTGTFWWDQAWVGVADLESLNRTSKCCEVSVYLSGYRMICWFCLFLLRLLIYSIEFTPLLAWREVWCFWLPFSSWLRFASNRAKCTLRPIRITDNMIWLDLNLFANNACLNE